MKQLNSKKRQILVKINRKTGILNKITLKTKKDLKMLKEKFKKNIKYC